MAFRLAKLLVDSIFDKMLDSRELGRNTFAIFHPHIFFYKFFISSQYGKSKKLISFKYVIRSFDANVPKGKHINANICIMQEKIPCFWIYPPNSQQAASK